MNLPDECLDHIPKENNPVVKYTGYEFPTAKNTPQNIRDIKDYEFIKKDVNLGSSDVNGC